jgi:L-rhamnose isomerase
MISDKNNQAYARAQEAYAELGVDTGKAIRTALALPLSMHCWQADDVVGFEVNKGAAGGGILAIGNHPGRARNADEARKDYEKAMSLVPGVLRLNLHALYAETGDNAMDRDALAPEHFSRWMDWAADSGIQLDFNPSFFAHDKARDGFTLSHADAGIRRFWIDHAIASRKIAEAMAKHQGAPCLVNHWIPDGSKDYPADRFSPRQRLVESLDAAIANEKSVDKELCADYVESKLFGIGSEEFVVGSAEFYSGYAQSRDIGFCLDMGHFHPTETIHDKLSAHLQFHKRLLVHASRPQRWDSDHVVVFNDDLRQIFLEIARGDAWDRIAFATDFFDASINRIAAYAIGMRATRKAMLYALLDPSAKLKEFESQGRNAARLALMDEAKTLPFGTVWDQLCLECDTPLDRRWMDGVEEYERTVLASRA